MRTKTTTMKMRKRVRMMMRTHERLKVSPKASNPRFSSPRIPPRQIWATQRAHGHSHSAFLLGNAYIWPPREPLCASGRGKASGHRDSAFLLGNAYILPPRELRRTRRIPRRGEGLWPLAQCASSDWPRHPFEGPGSDFEAKVSQMVIFAL